MGLVHWENGQIYYYPYTPSEVAGWLFMALFAAVTLAHVGHMFWVKTWYFIPLILGGICETFGHYGRAWAGQKPNSPSPFMLQLMLILVSPVFICATMYVTLGRLKQSLLGQPRRRCSPTTFFVLTDIVAFCTQIGGGLVQVTGDLKIMAIGDKVILGGLAFQLCVLAIYQVLVVRFYRAAVREVVPPVRWRPFAWMLMVSVVAVWVRNLVRLVEFVQGFHGFVSEHEAMLYVFDSLLMFAIMVLFLVLHPGRLVRALESGREGFELKSGDRD